MRTASMFLALSVTALAGCNSVETLQKDVSRSVDVLWKQAKEYSSTPATSPTSPSPTPTPSGGPQFTGAIDVQPYSTRYDEVKRKIDANVDFNTRRTRAELVHAYKLYLPKFSARLRQVKTKNGIGDDVAQFNALIQIQNDGYVSRCKLLDESLASRRGVQKDLCFAMSTMYFGRKATKLRPYAISLTLRFPK